MTEEAPPPQAHTSQLDDDLINYEADDIDVGAEPGAAATSLTTSKMTISKTTADPDEIDWEDHDNTGGDSLEANGAQGLGSDTNAASPFDADINGSLSEVPNPTDAAAVSSAGDAAFDHDLDVGLGDGLEGDDIAETGDVEEEQEITYDEDEAPAAPKQADDDYIDYEEYPDDAVDQAEGDGDAEAQDAEDEDDVQVVGERQVEVVGVEDQSDEQSDEEEGSPVDEGECPEITVTYRNEEFPLFHGQKNFDNQDGFFHDQSILDVTVDQLLRKFRHELTSDLGPQDEIVLQIDEMGLEYAESTHKDHCISVTLRQIHEIFEQLSKNQDPDATRTLYTNLIIRPHPAKRLDLLINEAFNGKGLDDVIYSFQSGHHDGGRPATEPSGIVDLDGDSSEVEYEDGSVVQDDEQDGDEEDVPDDDVLDDEDPASHAEMEAGIENDGKDADQDDYDDNAEDDIVDMVDLDDDNPQVDEFTQENYGEEGENENGLDTMGQAVEDVGDDAFTNPDYEDEGDQFTREDADGNEGDENAGFDLLDFGEDDAAVAEPDQPDKGNTSATVTLNGDGENEITYEDDGVNGTNSGGVTGRGDTGDAFDEIDWRDGADEEAAVSKDAGATPAKRPHSEVEVDIGLDEESEAKRQRS